MFKRELIFAGAAALVIFVNGPSFAQAAPDSLAIGKLPAQWYLLPEDAVRNLPLKSQEQWNFLTTPTVSSNDEEALGASVDRLFQANARALEQIRGGSSFWSQHAAASGDHVPWHLEYFLNDLAVTGSGTIGLLVAQGTATVQTFWRRQNGTAAPRKPGNPELTSNPSALTLSDETSSDELSTELEPVVRGLMATGKVNNESALRRNLMDAALNLQAIASGVSDNPGYHWWVSRLRLDLFVDASGDVLPFASAGGAVQVRVEWFRIQSKSGRSHAIRRLSETDGNLRRNMAQFVASMAEDLEVLGTESSLGPDFGLYQIRVGLGASVKGDVALAKGTGGFLAHVYFTNDMARPKVKPPTSPEHTLGLIEANPAPHHLEFVHANQIEYARAKGYGDGAESVIYRISRERFRKGLLKAEKMASFFARRAADSRNSSSQWKIFELRTGFDASITGDLGFASIVGAVSLELDFYNQNF